MSQMRRGLKTLRRISTFSDVCWK